MQIFLLQMASYVNCIIARYSNHVLFIFLFAAPPKVPVSLFHANILSCCSNISVE